MDSGECAVAPSTPKPPARLTAATTSRQWLKASRGNSIPSMSQIGDFMAVVTPGGGLSGLLFIGLNLRILLVTLAHHRLGCQAAPGRVPDAVQRSSRCTAEPGPRARGLDPGSA